jgi:mannitol/fructose-specific phosphotransferase system IIA component (Ntr-type)
MELKNALKQENILLDVDASDWVEAVRKAGQLMVQLGLVRPSYIDGMIEVIKTLGPYVVIIPGVAMPHARPDQGSIKIGMVLLRLKNPVYFGSPNDPVDFVIAFSAVDNISHTGMIRELALFLARDGIVDKLRNAETVEDLRLLIE